MNKVDLFTSSLLKNFVTAFQIFLQNSNLRKQVSSRLKIWALFIPLVSVIPANGQEFVATSLHTTAAESDMITINIIGGNKMDYDKLRELKGNVNNREAQGFSFCLINAIGKKVYSSDIMATDDKFDEPNEDFILLMPDKLPEAQYQLIIYNDSKNNQRKENEKHHMVIGL